jgi:predicted ATPase
MPIAGLVRETFGVDEDADVDSARARLVAGLAAIGLPAEPAVPYLLPLLGLKQAADALAGQSPAAIRWRTIDAVKQVCLAASRRQPVVWAVEDLHWIDRSSEDVLDAIAAEVADSAVLLVTTYRPGHRPTWSERPHASGARSRLTSGEPGRARAGAATRLPRSASGRRARRRRPALHRGAGAR